MSRFSRNRYRGSVMVEMAGAVALLLFMVFGITELGRALYQLNMINKAVTSGARYLARVPEIVTSPQSDPACEWQGEWEDAVERARNMVVYGDEGITSPILPDMNAEVDKPAVRSYTTEGGDSYSDCVVTITASAEFRSIFGEDTYPRLFGGESDVTALRLTAVAEERYLRRYYAAAQP